MLHFILDYSAASKNSITDRKNWLDTVLCFIQKVRSWECKAGKGSRLHSLNYFLDTHTQSEYGIRFSSQNYSMHEKIHSYPLYAIAKVMTEHNREIQAAVKQLV